MMENFKTVLLIVLVILALLLFTIGVSSLPCQLYRYSPSKDIPGRCIGEFTR